MAQSGSVVDVTEILTEDHRDMLALIAEVEKSSDPRRQRDTIETVIAEVMRHAVAEEMFVYPAIEEHAANGAALVSHDKREHQEIVEVMKDLEDIEATALAFLPLVRRLEEMIRHHATSEETEQFPQLRASLPANVLRELGAKVEAAKSAAPTRPHPSAPHSELFHKTIGPGVGMVDRLLDSLSGRLVR